MSHTAAAAAAAAGSPGTREPAVAWQYAETAELLAVRQREPGSRAGVLNRAVGLDWAVYQTPAYAFVPAQLTDEPRLDTLGVVGAEDAGRFVMVGSRRRGSRELIPDYLLNVRDDSHRVVGIVKRRYRIVQNSQAPAFLDALIDAGEASYHAAGELHGGSQVWWLLRLAGDTRLGEEARERLETFILLTNSHDGSTSLSAAVVGLRPRSLSTFVWPLPGVRRTLAVRHTDSAADGALEARRILALALDYQAALAAVAERMLQLPVDDDRFAAFVRTLIPARSRRRREGRTVNQRGITMAEKANELIAQIYFEHEALADIRGTLWGAVQAVQFYADHETINRTTADASRGENRFKRLTSEPNLGSKAFANAVRLLR